MSLWLEYFSQLTRVDEASWSTFAELFGFVGQRDLDNSGNVARWCLNPDGVGSDELHRKNVY